MADDRRQGLRVRPTLEDDFAQWRRLYSAYADFYRVRQSDAMARQVGSWILDPVQRGAGAADLLLHELARIAGENGWSVVRWITADDNYRGRAKYDQHATRTTWVT